MNDKLELDCLTTCPKYEKKAMSVVLVLETWKGILMKYHACALINQALGRGSTS